MIDITVLCTFVATTQKQDNLFVVDGVIDSVTRTDVDPQFPDPIATEPVIAEIFSSTLLTRRSIAIFALVSRI